MNGDKKTECRLIFACGCLAVSGGLTLCAVKISGFAEWYATHIYPVLVSCIGRLSGIVPFSLVEIGLYLMIALIIGTGIHAGIKGIRRRRGAEEVLSWAAGLFLAASILMLLYTMNCGINYRRISFSEKSGILTESYGADELKQTCEWLTEEVNLRADIVKRGSNGEMRMEEEEGREAIRAMENLAEIYPALQGYYPQPKKVGISEILSYQSLSGVYSPFTVEANYNQDMTAYNIPFTMCHELSHLRGFMQEEEANFIAFLACEQSERVDFQYSGYLLGWIYSMNALRRVDEAAWQEVRMELKESVEADLKANSQFWNSYDGTVAKVSDKVNDTYLKVNGQSDGVESYDRMVDLLAAYYRAGRKK